MGLYLYLFMGLYIPSPIICFFFLENQTLITLKITENNFGFFYNSANIEFETLAMLYSDSARYFTKIDVLKLFFSCILTKTERSEVPKLGNSSGRKSSNIYREQKRVSN